MVVTSSTNARMGETTKAENRKSEYGQNDLPNPKLKEFLEVMQPPSKSKVWANEGSFGTGANDISVVENTAVVPGGSKSDEEYQHVAKKRKLSPPIVPEKKPTSLHQAIHPEVQTKSVANDSNEPTVAPPFQEDALLPVTNATATSDAEWLRSRTSRLLDLVDDAYDDTGSKAPLPSGESDEVRVHRQSPLAQTEIPDAGNIVEEEHLQSLPKTTADLDAEDDKNGQSLSTGRLFVRNLSYATSESELRDHFVSYGVLEEVSLRSLIYVTLLRNL